MSRPDARRGERGLTIVELMMAMLILGIVVAAAFNVSFSIMNSYRDHRRAMAVERSARGAMSIISSAVRNASPGVPTGAIVDLVGCETTWDAIHVDNSTTGPDALDVIYAKGGVTTSLTGAAPFTQASASITVESSAGFSPGDQVLITDLAGGHLLPITTVNGNVLGLSAVPDNLCPQGADFPDFSYATRSLVIRAAKARFEVVQADPPYLTIDPDGNGNDTQPEAVAEGIEDLQVAIAVDRDADGVIEELGGAGNDDDWVYNDPADTDLPDMATTPYRAVRITLTARSVGENSEVTAANSVRPPAEDRAAGTQPDQYKRRSLSTTVEIRNLQGSPDL